MVVVWVGDPVPCADHEVPMFRAAMHQFGPTSVTMLPASGTLVLYDLSLLANGPTTGSGHALSCALWTLSLLRPRATGSPVHSKCEWLLGELRAFYLKPAQCSDGPHRPRTLLLGVLVNNEKLKNQSVIQLKCDLLHVRYRSSRRL